MKEPDRIDINPSPKNTPQEVSESSVGANKSGKTEIFLAKHNNKNKNNPLKWRSEKQERLKVILIFDSKAWALKKKSGNVISQTRNISQE